MTRSMLLLSVALASYAVLSSVGSLVAMAIWRSGALAGLDSPGLRARRLVMLRALPAVAAAALLAIVVMPAVLLFEPDHEFEAVGPAFTALATLGAALLTSGAVTAAVSAFATWRAERAWLRSAQRLDFDPPAGVPAYAVDSFAPAIALVGVFAPKLIAARKVVDACDRHELANIVAHERGHLHAKDNLKRWLMAAAPDALRWTPLHHAIALAWDDAAEDAADDAATAGKTVARVDLAALLIKVARLSPDSSFTAATVSPFIERDRLDRRVRRLLSASPGPRPSRSTAFQPLLSAGLGASVLSVLSNPSALQVVHEMVEAMVAFGR